VDSEDFVLNRNLALYWLRDDLRLADNPALMAAAKHDTVLCVYVL
jgi:deoxyribodipyrimidine photo-lyase